jgi:hypothetical protein
MRLGSRSARMHASSADWLTRNGARLRGSPLRLACPSRTWDVRSRSVLVTATAEPADGFSRRSAARDAYLLKRDVEGVRGFGIAGVP